MSYSPFFTIIAVAITSFPLIIAVIVREINSRRKPKDNISETEKKSRFGLFYILIQLIITTLSVIEGMFSTGTEDAPVWGMVTMVTWSAAISVTPLLAILLDIVFQIVIAIFRDKKNGA